MKTIFPILLIALWAVQATAADTVPTDAMRPDDRFNMTETMEHTKHQEKVLPKPANTPTPELSSETLLAQPELLKRALISSLVLNNTDAVRELLPLYRSLPDAQNGKENRLINALSQALLARDDQQYSRAAQYYRQALQDFPNIPTIRFYLADSLFIDHQNGEAEQIFREINEQNQLPKNLAVQIPMYLKALEERKKWQFYGGMHYTRDNNINNASGKDTVVIKNGVWRLPQAESAQGLSYRAGASRDWYLGKHFSLRSSVDADGTFYWDNHKRDDLSIRFSLGAAYQNARSESALLPYFERRWYGTERYARESGLRLETSRRLNSRHRIFAAAEYGKERYDKYPAQNGTRSNTSLTWLFAPSVRRYFTFGTDFSHKKARDDDDGYRRYGIRGSWSEQWKNGLHTNLSLGAAQRRYQGKDLLNILRRDREFFAGLSFAHRKVEFWGIRPRLVLRWHKTRSNHPFYGYRKANAFIQLDKSF